MTMDERELGRIGALVDTFKDALQQQNNYFAGALNQQSVMFTKKLEEMEAKPILNSSLQRAMLLALAVL